MSPLSMKRVGRAALLVALSSLLPVTARAEASLRPAQCTVQGMLEDVRAAMKRGSPALKRYVKMRLKEAALAMPAESLLAAMSDEQDPEVLEALGAALATKASNAEDPGLIQPLLARATGDSDPALRAGRWHPPG